MMSKSWIEYKTWYQVFKNKEILDQFIEERNKAHELLLKSYFDWSDVWKQAKPKLSLSAEWIGIIKCKKDGKTLYIDEMNGSTTKRSTNAAKYISNSLFNKYINKTGYFIFHTHPSNITSPFPSDTDIEISLSNSITPLFFGDVLITEYGIMIYYMPLKYIYHIIEKDGDLAYYTVCHDIISAWNAFYNMSNYKLQDRFNIIKKFGMHCHIIESEKYSTDNKTIWSSLTITIPDDNDIKEKLLNTILKLKDNENNI